MMLSVNNVLLNEKTGENTALRLSLKQVYQGLDNYNLVFNL